MTVIFVVLVLAGFIVTCLFGEQALQTYDARSIAGVAFGLSLMLSALLILPGA